MQDMRRQRLGPVLLTRKDHFMDKLRTPRRTLGIVLAVAATMALAMPVAAADSVTQAVTAGARTASVADLALSSLAYSHSVQTSNGSMTLTADDSTGSGAGWNVTILSSAFVLTDGDGTKDISAANFALTAADAPVMTAGQAINVTAGNGPAVPTTTPIGTLDSARKTVQAGVGYGQGTYTQNLPVTLTIPAFSAAGTYTGTLTTSITAAP
jgi:hypothetical protein